MSSPLTPGRWILFILINIIVSAVTAFLVMRALVQAANPPAIASIASNVAAAAPTTSAVRAPEAAQPAPAMPAATPATGVEATPQSVLQPSQPTQQARPVVLPTIEQPAQPPAAQTNSVDSRQPTATPVSPPPTAVIQAPAAAAPAPQSDQRVRISTVVYPGQRTREAVVIVNEGDQVDMTGWTITSPRGQTYTFPTVLLFKDSFINLHSTKGVDVPTDLFWNLDDPVWQKGDMVTLKHGEETKATFTVK
jgi:hypothetical protein